MTGGSFEYVTNVNFSNRYVLPEKLFAHLTGRYAGSIQEVGRSSLGLPVYQFSIGTGKTKVLGWSQMHGNESTATLAMLDLLSSMEGKHELRKHIFGGISLDFVFMLNPDGAQKWTRRNAMGIDINRDFIKENAPETRILKKVLCCGGYDFALNLHDQRSIFSTGGTNPASISFLAPPQDQERSISSTRKRSMEIISEVYLALKDHMPGRIGRYSDTFSPTCFGDNLMKEGISSILFEGGHSPQDYLRKETRKYYTYALFYALSAISSFSCSKKDGNFYQTYFDIPENQESHYDLIYRNVRMDNDLECSPDIAVQYKEVIEEGKDEISFVPVVAEIGDLGSKKGWKEIDCTGKKYVGRSKYPKLDFEVDFSFESQ